MSRARCFLLVFCAAVLVLAGSARAHDVAFSKVSATFFADGTYAVDFDWDADAFLADIRPGHMAADDYEVLLLRDEASKRERLDELRHLFLVRVRLRFDGEAAEPEVVLPLLGQGKRPVAHDRFPGRKVRLEGAVPSSARTFVFWASRSFGVVTLEVRREGDAEPFRQVLPAAERSEPFLLREGKSEPPGRLAVLRQYLILGFEHILPLGLDHILFVVGLFLLSPLLRPLLVQISLFTVAHTVTLALSTLGVVALPSGVVEPLIAVSIAFVAIENLFTSRLHAWRPTLVFGFGLLHGMGFAGVLRELGLPRGELVTGLLSFNVGVELGQLAVIALLLLTVGWWRGKEWYRRRITVPASALIAVVGMYWVVERIWG